MTKRVCLFSTSSHSSQRRASRLPLLIWTDALVTLLAQYGPYPNLLYMDLRLPLSYSSCRNANSISEPPHYLTLTLTPTLNPTLTLTLTLTLTPTVTLTPTLTLTHTRANFTANRSHDNRRLPRSENYHARLRSILADLAKQCHATSRTACTERLLLDRSLATLGKTRNRGAQRIYEE